VGIPSLVFGPGSIAQAHTNDEWVDLPQVALAARVLEETAARFFLRFS
jgi:acetylornithine deacetylase/succinyl-diaminopimelate desuccinylase-like protein